ncbi:MAG: hypothetical protein WBG29_16110 [Candidatus Acidiferrales bacterium]
MFDNSPKYLFRAACTVGQLPKPERSSQTIAFGSNTKTNLRGVQDETGNCMFEIAAAINAAAD